MEAAWKEASEHAPALAAHAERIAGELAAARGKFPEATLDDRTFARALAEKLVAQRDQPAALSRLRVDDFLLAQWCATGDPRAIAAFERVHDKDLGAIFARFRRLSIAADELRQALRIKLFVGSNGRAPRIGDYSGFGFLQNWLRVTGLRAMVDIARGEKARQLEELLEDDALFAVAAPSSDISSRYTRAELGHAIKQAFARAVAGLAPRARNFLRHAHVDQLTLDQIAALYGIHRATVARTLGAAREELVTSTRRELGELLGLPDADLDSMVRGADSRIELSLSRVLAAPVLAEESAE
jgi:RNA polymerase sigma-70 factor (ECF subfamily)